MINPQKHQAAMGRDATSSNGDLTAKLSTVRSQVSNKFEVWPEIACAKYIYIFFPLNGFQVQSKGGNPDI